MSSNNGNSSNAAVAASKFSPLELRALELLANGHQAVTIAAHLGVTESRISQIVSEPQFSAELATRKFQRAIAASTRDNKWDELEDIYLDRLKALAPMAFKFDDVLRAVTVINAAKRRGGSPVQEAQAHAEVISLTLPTCVVQNFKQNIQVNIANQVIQVGEQPLQTIQAKQLDELAGTAEEVAQKSAQKSVQKSISNESNATESEDGQERQEQREVLALGSSDPAVVGAVQDFARLALAPASSKTQAGFIRIGAGANKEAAGSRTTGG